MMDIMSEVILWGSFVTLGLIFLYRYLVKNYDFWEKQNIPFVKPKLFVGNLTFSEPLQVTEKKSYETFGRVYGRFEGRSPVLSVAEPDMIKKILVKDFLAFPNHRDLKCNDPLLDNNLFALENHDWRRVRNIVSPTFTSSKLKKMLSILEASSDDVLRKIKQSMEENDKVICQDIFGGFSITIILKSSFGIQLDSEQEGMLIRQAKKLLECEFSWRSIGIMLFPKLMKIFNISVLNPKPIKYYQKLVVDAMCFRKDNNQERSDFLQQMMNAECKEESDSNNNETHGLFQNLDSSSSSQTQEKGLTHEESMAQCVNFIMAGFDATTSLLSYATYNLAVHQDIQENLYDEIKRTLHSNHNSLSYEVLKEMKLLDAVVDETLRLCPALVRIERKAEFDYTFEDHNISIKKGMLVSIPVYALHRDPEFYKNPDVFNPYRFLSDELKPPMYTYLPFGGGPRLCIGKRFVQMSVKMMIAKLLLQYKLQLADKFQPSLEILEARGTLKVAEVVIKVISR